MVIYGININMAVRQPINILHSSSWRQAHDLYVMDSGAWRTIKFAWILQDGAWEKVYDYTDHVILYGTSNYKFTPTGTAGTGNAYPNNGMPSDYNSSTYGAVIWDSWVGVLVYPTGSYVDLKFTADNQFVMYANQTQVLSGTAWQNWDTARIDTVAGEPLYISANLTDFGQEFGFAGYIKNEDGSYLTKTSTSWVSA